MSCISISPTNPCDGGTAIISMTFLDENEGETPVSNLQWQLINKAGDIINERDFASNSFSGDTVVLSGADLLLATNLDSGERWFAVKGTYNSDAGSDLPLIGELKFTIVDVKNVDPIA